ncbi:LacI family DNA-binding transcriptional regulator [Marasmitruncus massiliensis]|uniref:LacI family DNA-binding transcriptional regulator n=1 Tax=Marasmitruncus massiliensis TaxID=1944642 RepID=UPI000C7D6A49|nr:LacI family DNA-binding transcriptional regulator [Marasmitruncus massiliensis]
MSTIADVAKEAGVSVATVSRVINGKGTVTAETAERVNAAIAKFHYQPNVWGRNLRRKESRMLLVLIPNITNPYYSSIVSGIEDTARRQDYTTILCITNSDKTREQEFLNLLRSGRADGAIFLATERDSLTVTKLARTYPVVQCCEYCGDEEIPHVSIDNFEAARQVLRHLLNLGHRQIGFVGSTNRFISTLQREEGYKSALEQAGLQPDERYLAYADDDYNFLSGVRAVWELLCLKDRPTAVFCISDMIALGAIRAANELGLDVPQDLTVVGFDDVEYASMFKPMLTTVSQPCYSLGKVSATMLLRQIATGEKGGAVFLEHKLILRDSSAFYKAGDE